MYICMCYYVYMYPLCAAVCPALPKSFLGQTALAIDHTRWERALSTQKPHQSKDSNNHLVTPSSWPQTTRLVRGLDLADWFLDGL